VFAAAHRLARKLDLPVVATNDCHYLKREDFHAHEVLLCIQTNTTLQDESRMRYTQDHYFKSPAEMGALFREIPEALENSARIAERCHFKLESEGHQLPHSRSRPR